MEKNKLFKCSRRLLSIFSETYPMLSFDGKVDNNTIAYTVKNGNTKATGYHIFPLDYDKLSYDALYRKLTATDVCPLKKVLTI